MRYNRLRRLCMEPRHQRAHGACIEAKTEGSYRVTETAANGCTALSNAIAIVTNSIPLVSIRASADSICPGDSAQICAFASNPFGYYWSIGETSQCIEAESAGELRNGNG